jgi:osmotically-inducible protein OsmY
MAGVQSRHFPSNPFLVPYRRSRECRSERETPPMTYVTVSAMIGTDADKVARRVAETLGYRYWGEKELLPLAQSGGFFSDLLVKEMEEKGPSWIQQWIDDKPLVALEGLRSVVYQAAAEGSGVFLGVGGQGLFRDLSNAFHVLLTGSKEKRIQRVMEENQSGRGAAEKIVARSDREKKRFYWFAFQEQWLDPGLYGQVLDMDRFNVEQAVRVIAAEAGKKEPVSPAGRIARSMEDLALLARIKAKFLEAGIPGHRVKVAVESGSVDLFGTILPQEEKVVKVILKGMEEIQAVHNFLFVVDA